jgi:hypothetical protein
MKSALITSIALLALAALPALARSPGGYESGLELDPRLISLPSVADGTVVAQKCEICVRRSFTLNASTRFYVADQEVSYVEFKRYVGSHPEAVVLLVTRVNQNVITRLTAQ